MRPLYIVLVAVAAALFGAIIVKDHYDARDAQIKIVRLEHTVKQTDSVFVHDTLIFTRVLKTVNQQHDSVYLHIHDSVFVTRFIGLQDSAIKACTLITRDCTARVAARDSLIAVYKSLRPSRISVGIGATCGYGFKGGDCTAGLTANVRVW